MDTISSFYTSDGFMRQSKSTRYQGSDEYGIFKCPICGEGFVPQQGWRYRKKYKGTVQLFCSYSCYKSAGGDMNRRYNKYDEIQKQLRGER